MTLKTLFTAVTQSDYAGPVLDQAIALAEVKDAHLEVMCLGLDRSQSGFYYAGANAMILQETISRARDEAQALEDDVTARLMQSDIRWNVDSGIAQIVDLARHVAARARFADLAILPKPYGEDRCAGMGPILEAALFNAGVPVLMVPGADKVITKPACIMLAWNESDEALAAARAALPFLMQAEKLRIVVIDPPAHGPSRSDPGGMIAQYLARHGVSCEIDVLSKTMPRITDVLLRHATDTETDMIVMGAYGHSRLREAMIGGATRHMLEHATLPVFLAR